MIVALSICLAAAVVTGLAVQAGVGNEGLLAPWLGHTSQFVAIPTVGVRQAKREDSESAGTSSKKNEEADSPYEEVHALFSDLTLGLVVLHILGVLAGSLIDKQNLPRAMLTGYKLRSAGPPDPTQSSRSGVV